MFIHSVYFWLRDDLSDEERSKFVEGALSLTRIETVRHGYLGTPAGTDRPIIDRTYTFGLVCAFDDVKGHDAYQDHPVHDDFRDSCSSFWKDVKIFDMETSSAQ